MRRKPGTASRRSAPTSPGQTKTSKRTTAPSQQRQRNRSWTWASSSGTGAPPLRDPKPSRPSASLSPSRRRTSS
eukprot:14224269-Heterocapsa_arctica.AAC.1